MSDQDRYGPPERWQEIKDSLKDAGHGVCNENGNSVLHSVDSLIAERTNLARLLAVEQSLSTGVEPFRCTDAECCSYGQPVSAGSCDCRRDMLEEHRKEVRAALALERKR